MLQATTYFTNQNTYTLAYNVDMELSAIFEKLGLSLALGLLVGMQRQRIGDPSAGLRTFALTTVLGTLCALLSLDHGSWILAAGFLGVTALHVGSHVIRSEDPNPGLTTEVAALVMFGVGAYLVAGHTEVALAVGGGVAVLLHFKTAMHQLVARFGEEDIKAIFQLVLLALVILPVLPNRTFGPYDVLNPHQIWRMVVLIVALGLAGYLIAKAVGQREGALVSGVVGGLVSSTATAASSARQSRDAPETVTLCAFVIFLSTTVAGIRVLIEVMAAAPRQAPSILPPLIAVFAWMVLLVCGLWFLNRPEAKAVAEHKNPARLKVALAFGVLYALALLAVAATREHLGTTSLYGVAFISGLIDMDAITLTSASLGEQGQIETKTAWQLILVAYFANLLFKAGIVAVLAGRRLFLRILVLFGLSSTGLFLVLMHWP